VAATTGRDLRSIQNRRFAGSAYPAVSQGRSQIFQELGGGSPRSVDCGPSMELAHGNRTADISARARPQDREAPGLKSQVTVGITLTSNPWSDSCRPY
jgi:hypothetical protein